MRGRNPQWRPSTGRLVGVLAVTVATVSFTGVRVSWGDTGTPLAAEGGSFADPIINLLQNDPAALTAISPFTPSYFDADVDQARQDFVAGATDYAVTELPLTAGEAATAAQNGRSFAYVPFAASPLAIAAVVECSQTSTLTATTFCGTIKVTVPILAQIFTDLPPTASPPPGGLGIGRWNDPELTALTPSLGGVSTASADITALEDVQPAASNYALETLFVNNATAKPIWDAYLKFYEGVTDDTPTDVWPHTNGTSGGDVTLAQSLIPVNEQANPPAPPSNPQTWGQGVVAPLPIDWTGAPRNIPTMAVQNAAGAFVQPSVASMNAALRRCHHGPDDEPGHVHRQSERRRRVPDPCHELPGRAHLGPGAGKGDGSGRVHQIRPRVYGPGGCRVPGSRRRDARHGQRRTPGGRPGRRPGVHNHHHDNDQSDNVDVDTGVYDGVHVGVSQHRRSGRRGWVWGCRSHHVDFVTLAGPHRWCALAGAPSGGCAGAGGIRRPPDSPIPNHPPGLKDVRAPVTVLSIATEVAARGERR